MPKTDIILIGSLTGGTDLRIAVDESVDTIKGDISHCLREGRDYVRGSDVTDNRMIIPIQVLRSHPIVIQKARIDTDFFADLTED